MLAQMDISSLLGTNEASNGGCLGGHPIGLCMFNAYIPKRWGDIGLGALTMDTHLDPWVDG